MKKFKVLSVVMAIMLIVSMPFGASAKSFSDVSESTHGWAFEAIQNMADIGVINGYSDGTFKPNNAVTKLESLLLTARILGVGSEENAELLDASIKKYGEIVDEYELTFGKDEICYLLIKDIIDEDELTDYISKANASLGMKRYEIAVLLTKALDAEDDVSKNLITSLEFADTEDIPAYAKKYVEYVFTNNIMNGVGDNMFSPNTDVTRAQMALLMDKLSKITGYDYFAGQVSEVDYDTSVIKIKNSEKTSRYIVNDDAILRLDGASITLKDISNGYSAFVTTKGDALYAIDFVTPLVEKEVKGVLTGKATGANNSVSFYVVDDDDPTPDTSVKESYPLSEGAVVTFEDEPATLNDLATGSYLTVSIKDGKIVTLHAYPKTKTVVGKVSAVEITPVAKLYIVADNGLEEGFVLASEVETTRNGKETSVSSVVAGDTITATVVYNRITKIIGTSKTQQVNGVIKEVVISANPRITVQSSDGLVTYPVTNTCTFEIAGKSAPTFYDLRVGESVSITLEGETIVKLVTNATDGVTQINGVVTSVNVSRNLIQVNYIDATSGVSVIEPVFIKSKATIIDILTGNTMKLSNVKEGSKITAFGVRTGGIFEATTINVSN